MHGTGTPTEEPSIRMGLVSSSIDQQKTYNDDAIGFREQCVDITSWRFRRGLDNIGNLLQQTADIRHMGSEEDPHKILMVSIAYLIHISDHGLLEDTLR